MASRLDRLIRDRTTARRRAAAAAAAAALRALRENGVEACVAGSLADGRFGLHSDVDLLVFSDVPATDVLRLVEPSLAGFDIDVVMARDLSPSALAFISGTQADESTLRQIAGETSGG
jgi:predicted nucleotidyltransferase